MPTAYLTGSTGFLGGHVKRLLIKAGWDVTCLCRKRPEEPADGARHVLGDVTDEASIISSMPDGCDAVFHLAADITHWKGASAHQNAVNVGGTRNVARAALAKHAKRFVHCSSDAAWGLQLPLIREDMPRLGCEEPINYQRSKFWGEEEIRCAMQLGLDAVIVNPANILGPGDYHGWSQVPVHMQQGLLRFAPPGSGAFAYVEDVAAAIVAAATLGRTGHNYLLGGVNTSYLTFMTLCAAGLHIPFPDVPISVEALMDIARENEAEADRQGSPPHGVGLDHGLVFAATVIIDSSKAERELDFRARPIEDIVALTLDWLNHQDPNASHERLSDR